MAMGNDERRRRAAGRTGMGGGGAGEVPFRAIGALALIFVINGVITCNRGFIYHKLIYAHLSLYMR